MAQREAELDKRIPNRAKSAKLKTRASAKQVEGAEMFATPFVG